MNPRVPTAVQRVIRTLRRNEYQGFVVGGAVRDITLGRKPRDWDVATDALPEAVEKIFPKTVPIGKKFGTVTVLGGGMEVQVTTFRSEENYKDRRRPSKVTFHSQIDVDLSRRDFTINAMAYDPEKRRFIDPFCGRNDLKARRLRTVGPATERFAEDTLRIIRAGRFISELGLRPQAGLLSAARAQSSNVRRLSAERIRDELSKLLLGRDPTRGLVWLDRAGVLRTILPELFRTKGVKQGGVHQYDVFRHTLRSVEEAPADLTLRLALLLHDVAKPIRRRRIGGRYRFFGHETVGARMAEKVLRRLRYPGSVIEDVSVLIRNHLFEAETIFSNDSAIRRLIRKVGEERIDRLVLLRKADVLGCGHDRRPSPKFDELKRRIRRIRRKKHALTLHDLAADGNDVMKWLKVRPGPEVGTILSNLLAAVLGNPELNNKKTLKKLARKVKAPNAVGD
ncbi:MAG: HD domain-containing protein [Pseudomonadota bacterium]